MRDNTSRFGRLALALRLRIGLLAYAGLALAGAALAYAGWRLAERPASARVVFLARGEPASDAYFQRFSQSFAERHPELARVTRIEAVSAPDAEAELPAFIARLRDAPPTVLVAQNGSQAQAAHLGAPEIPLVFSSHTDPRELGVVSGLLKHPEPATGLWINDELDAKRLELLMDAYPGLRRVGILGDREWLDGLGTAREQMHALAQGRGVQLQILTADSVDEAIALAARPPAAANQAWCLPRTSLTIDSRLAEAIAAAGKVVMAGHTPDIHGAAHISYALDKGFVAPSLADLVARLLRHENPADIPVQLPQRFQLAVRLTTDPRLPTPSSEVVRRADLVVR